MDDLFYTGVGSRQTPPEILAWITQTAAHLDALGWVVRTGGADGADTAFERGAVHAQLFLPWAGFNGHQSPWCEPPERAYLMARDAHPVWERLSAGGRALHARNAQQVLGGNLDCPSKFLLCWTPDGCEEPGERTNKTGGTATAIILAARRGIPVFNMQRGALSFERFCRFIA